MLQYKIKSFKKRNRIQWRNTSLWKELQNRMAIFPINLSEEMSMKKWVPDLSSRQESRSRKSSTINREPDKTRVDWDYKSKTCQRCFWAELQWMGWMGGESALYSRDSEDLLLLLSTNKLCAFGLVCWSGAFKLCNSGEVGQLSS